MDLATPAQAGPVIAEPYDEGLPTPDMPVDVVEPVEAPAEPRGKLWFLKQAVEHHNLAEEMPEEMRGRIAADVLEDYELDKRSMARWRGRMEDGLDLARLVKKDRKIVGKGANIRFPLVTSAALQFNARAYPAVVPGSSPVHPKVYGADPQGMKAARGHRVAAYMEWQLTAEVTEWESETDSLLVTLPIVGTMLRKVWYNPAQGRIQIKLCEAGTVVVNDKVKSLDVAPRVTEELSLYPYEIEERVRAKLFLREDYGDAEEGDEDRDAARTLIEQHRRLDLDEDGYPEPYVVTVCKNSQKLLRVVANYDWDDIRLDEQTVRYEQVGVNPDGSPKVEVVDGELLAIDRRDHFVAYHFLPSMDGGFWGTGLGMLLGDISEGINSTFNILIDSGHRSSMGGGFIAAQNFSMKGGVQRFDFGEWKQVNALGADIRQSLVPLQFPEPSMVMFQMLGMLIEAGREIASVKDIVTGDAGTKNMTATTTISLIEQGLAVFTAAYKRIYRALREEFRMIARINAETVSDQKYMRFHDIMGPAEEGQQPQPMQISAAQDFGLDDMDIAPVADPRAVTKMQKLAIAQLLREMAVEGTVDPREASRRALEAVQVEDIDKLIPEPNPIEMALAERQAAHADTMMSLQRAMAEIEAREKLAKIEAEIADTAKTYAEIEDMDRKAVLESRKLMLEAQKAQLDGALGLLKNDVDRRRIGSVAGQPRNGTAARPQAQAGRNAEGGAVVPLLGSRTGT